MGLLAALVALLLGAASSGELDFAKVELLCASSVITAFLAALALGELCPNPSTFLFPPGPHAPLSALSAFTGGTLGILPGHDTPCGEAGSEPHPGKGVCAGGAANSASSLCLFKELACGSVDIRLFICSFLLSFI